MKDEYLIVPISQLPHGKVASRPIYDIQGTMLLPAQGEVGDRFLALLKRRILFDVQVHIDDVLGWGLKVPRSEPSPPPAPPKEEAPPSLLPMEEQDDFSGSIRLDPNTTITFDRTRVKRIPEAMLDFARRHVQTIQEERPVVERRRHSRFPIVMTISLVPLDSKQLVPNGDPYEVVLRNLSRAGVSILSSRAMVEKYVAIEIKTVANPDLRFVVEILRCSPFGRFYEVAGRIAARLPVE